MLGDAGFECELLEAEPGRPNLIARLRGEADGPDPVPAQPRGHRARRSRRVDPRSLVAATSRDGLVWGRGALDMKDQVAAEVAAALALARVGLAAGARRAAARSSPPTRRRAAHQGASWLCEEHPDKVRCDFVVNEGGGAALRVRRPALLHACVGEKGVFRFHLRAHGRAGHGSVPSARRQRAAEAGARCSTRSARAARARAHRRRGSRSSRAVLGETSSADRHRARARASSRELDPLLAAFLAEPMLGVTLTPTKAERLEKENVIPSRAEVVVDCRVPPGMDEADVRERIEAVLGERTSEIEVEFIETVVGNRSPLDTPLADAIREWVAEADRAPSWCRS